ncbi:hypothetical protein [Actinopolymorpha alba]|uniref:hypothetical protein n=1 Tax=Actinopolymorpha alba TaxID=533267 RepID=UPI00036ADA67|nr:hypothetical protein [Actinopolymorpha alba]
MTGVRPRAAVLATIGALAVAGSAYFDWLSNRSPRGVQLERLLMQPDSVDTASSYWLSMAAPLAVAGAIGVLGALVLSRVVLWLAFLVELATLALWVTTVAFDAAPGQLSIGDLQPGAWISAGGLVLLLIGAIALRPRSTEDEEEAEDDNFFRTPPLKDPAPADRGF